MSEIDDVARRLDRLERLVEEIAAKVGISLAKDAQPKPSDPPTVRVAPSPPPPPPPSPPPPPQVPPAATETIWTKPQPQPAPKIDYQERVVRDKQDTEYLIGRRYLPIAGAVVTILGFICLAALAISRGWVNPKMQFGGELLLCSLFGLIGLRKVNEKDNFGTILVAVALSGFYLSLTGAFFFKGLLRAETYVTSFFIVSFASHAFSWWKSSKPFLFLGIFGGISAALMAIGDSQPVLNILLHAIAMIPAWLLIARKKWAKEGLVVWMSSTVLTLPALGMGSSNPAEAWVIVVTFWLTALIGGHALLQANGEQGLMTKELVAIGVFTPAVTPLLFSKLSAGTSPVSSWPGFFAVLVLGAITWASSSFRLKSPCDEWLRRSAFWLLLTVPPMMLTPFEAVVVYLACSIALAVLAKRRQDQAISYLAVTETTLLIAAYVTWQTTWPGHQQAWHLPILGLMLITVMLVAGLAPPKGKEESWSAVAGFLCWLIVLKATFVTLLTTGLNTAVIYCIGTWIYVIGAALACQLGHRLNLAWLTAVIGATALYCTAALTIVPGIDPWRVESPLLALTLFSGSLLARSFSLMLPDRRETVFVTASVFLWPVVARLLWTLLGRTGMDDLSSTVISVTLTASMIAGVSLLKRWGNVALLSVIVFCCAAGPYLLQAGGSFYSISWSRQGELWALTFALGALVWIAFVVRSYFRERTDVVMAWAVLPVWMISARIAHLNLVWPPYNWQNVLTLETTTLTIGLAASLVALRYKWRPMVGASLMLLVVALVLYPLMKVPVDGMTSGLVPIGRAENLAVLVALLGYSLLLSRAAHKSDFDESLVQHLGAPLNWAIVSGLFIHTLDLPPLGLSFDASVSVAWTVFAATMLLIGFRYDAPVLRYWALGVFGAAIVKVVVYDLTFLDPFIKVVVLIALGAVMIGGGYIYIRSQAARDATPEVPPPQA